MRKIRIVGPLESYEAWVLQQRGSIFFLELCDSRRYRRLDKQAHPELEIFFIDPVPMDSVDLLTLEEIDIIVEELAQVARPVSLTATEEVHRNSLRRIIEKLVGKTQKENSTHVTTSEPNQSR